MADTRPPPLPAIAVVFFAGSMLPNMAGKLAIVTGANTGIGKVVAQGARAAP